MRISAESRQVTDLPRRYKHRRRSLPPLPLHHPTIHHVSFPSHRLSSGSHALPTVLPAQADIQPTPLPCSHTSAPADSEIQDTESLPLRPQPLRFPGPLAAGAFL